MNAENINKKPTFLSIPIISFNEYRNDCLSQLKTHLMDETIGDWNILAGGIPKLDPKDLAPFVKWFFLQTDEGITKAAVETNECYWIIRGSEALIWLKERE